MSEQSIARYDIGGEDRFGDECEFQVVPSPTGDWVRYEDHAAAVARVEKERDAARDAVREVLVTEGCGCDCWDDPEQPCQHGEPHHADCVLDYRCFVCRIEAAIAPRKAQP